MHDRAKRGGAEYLRGFAAANSRRELKPLLGRLFADPSQVTRQLVDDLLRYKRLDGVGDRVEAGHMLHMEAANDVVRALRGAMAEVKE